MDLRCARGGSGWRAAAVFSQKGWYGMGGPEPCWDHRRCRCLRWPCVVQLPRWCWVVGGEERWLLLMMMTILCPPRQAQSGGPPCPALPCPARPGRRCPQSPVRMRGSWRLVRARRCRHGGPGVGSRPLRPGAAATRPARASGGETGPGRRPAGWGYRKAVSSSPRP